MTVERSPIFTGPIEDAVALAENTAYAGTQYGRAIMISASVAGTVTLTLLSGHTIVVNVVAGDNIYPFVVTKAAVGTATISAYYLLV